MHRSQKGYLEPVGASRLLMQDIYKEPVSCIDIDPFIHMRLS